MKVVEVVKDTIPKENLSSIKTELLLASQI